jgi:hypothetical protein
MWFFQEGKNSLEESVMRSSQRTFGEGAERGTRGARPPRGLLSCQSQAVEGNGVGIRLHGNQL